MKFIKIFMLTVAAVLFASCSDDDETLNSMQTSVGFETEAIAIKESAHVTHVGAFCFPSIGTIVQKDGFLRLY